MDNMIVSSTNYIPLQPPYRIIKYSNKIGVQIGIQSVTYSVGNPLRTVTHNYPAVAVEDNITPSGDKEISFDSLSDFEVWDNVETKIVSVLGTAGAPLSWMDFIKILWHDHARMNNNIASINKTFIFNKLLKYNKSQELPAPDIYNIHLHTESSDGNPQVVCSARDDVFALNVVWTDDLMELEKRLVQDLIGYLHIISPNRSARGWALIYETGEDRLRPLVERLNANKRATTFRNVLVASATVHFIPPYNKDEKKNAITVNLSPSSGNETEGVSEDKLDENWNSCFDGFLHPNLNPQAIKKALETITHTYFPKNERGFWWVFVTVIDEIHWLEKKNNKQVLKWANLHFECGWDWNKENQFKFSEINKTIRNTHPSSKWNSSLTGNITGDYYGELAKTMKETFIEIVNGGKMIDKSQFIKSGCTRINNGYQ